MCSPWCRALMRMPDGGQRALCAWRVRLTEWGCPMVETFRMEIGFEQDPMQDKIDHLQKKATKAKKDGDLDKALSLCEEALYLAEKDGISESWAMQPHMKLAAYLTDAGKAEDAWTYCELWLSATSTE